MKIFLKISFALLTAAVTVFWVGCSEQAMTEINMTEEEVKAFFLAKADEVEITDTSVIFIDSSGELREIEKIPTE